MKQNIHQLLNKLSDLDIFGFGAKFLDSENVWQRHLRLNTSNYIDFDNKIDKETVLNYGSLFANRVLSYLYERDLVFLPDQQYKIEKDSDFYKFYNVNYNECCALLRLFLEEYCLSFIDKEVQVTGNWTKEKFLEYYQERTRNISFPVLNKLINFDIKELAIKTLLIQHSLDFLVEASHMTKIIAGDFGKIQSEIFKVLIDEFGYGVHNTKHSQLFKETLKSIGLETDSHKYWQFYQTSTLLLNNLFHYITSNKQHFFKYLGALCLAEQMFGPYCQKVAECLTTVFHDKVNKHYYLEHKHIDKYHADTMFNNVILKVIDLYGEQIIREIVTGMEWVIYVQGLCDRDFIEQMNWVEKKDFYKSTGMKIKDLVLADKSLASKTFIEPYDELSTTHVHDQDELCIVNNGQMEFINGFASYTTLLSGEATIIKKNRLHGAIIKSKECNYTVYSIGNYKNYVVNTN